MSYAALVERFEELALNYRMNLSLRHRYLYLEIPKCGCTTIKGNLGRHELIGSGATPEEVAAYVDSPHASAWTSPFVKPYQLGAEAFDVFLVAPDVLRFVFVRNPFTRVASGYLDRIVAGRPAISELRPHLAAVTGLPADEITGRDISFRHFLQALARCAGPSEMNTHFRPQTALMAADLIAYHLIEPLERMDEAMVEIAGRAGLAGFRYDRHPHTRRTAERLADLYDATTTDLVRHIFADDFRQLGYSTDLREATRPPDR